MVDLNLVSWNRPKMTELVIMTIFRNTPNGMYRLMVFDNGSEPETVEMLKRLRDYKFIDNLFLSPTNVGLEMARQHLLSASEDEYIVCIDNDCLPPSMWLPDLKKLMEKYEDFAAISLRTPVMIGTGNIFEEADAAGDDIVEFPHPGGSFRIMRTQAVKDVHGWDRPSTGRGSEEKYICGKLRDAGWRTAFATDVKTLHLFGDRAQTSERWGYAEGLKPEDTGHSDISHPALTNGDNFEEVAAYSGEELAERYFNGHGSN